MGSHSEKDILYHGDCVLLWPLLCCLTPLKLTCHTSLPYFTLRVIKPTDCELKISESISQNKFSFLLMKNCPTQKIRTKCRVISITESNHRIPKHLELICGRNLDVCRLKAYNVKKYSVGVSIWSLKDHNTVRVVQRIKASGEQIKLCHFVRIEVIHVTLWQRTSLLFCSCPVIFCKAEFKGVN